MLLACENGDAESSMEYEEDENLGLWSLMNQAIEKVKCFIKQLNCLRQCFSTFFCLRHPYLVFKTFGGTLASLMGVKFRDKTNGGTPGTSSRHPSVPRHPGWEPLV